MAQLREGSVIKKPTGDEVIATVSDIPSKVSELENDTNFDVVEDITTKEKYKIIIENGVPYFEEI